MSLAAAPGARIAAQDEVPYRVSELQPRTPTILEVSLRPLTEPLGYLSGQYVLLEDRDRRIEQRSYSIANAPRADGSISLLITRVPGGQASDWVHGRLEPGDEVILTGPYGTFVAEAQSSRPCLYLAGGSGLAPMLALIEAALGATAQRPLTLLFSARTESDVIDRERFAHWQAAQPNFRFIRTLTRGPGPDPHGHIPDVLAGICPDLSGHELFIAGAPGLVNACTSAGEALGAAREQIHTEPFFAEPEPWSNPPPAPAAGR
ncbi:MAG: FAD-binding oxidoreductase [Solirubrobacteraceae bacterium]